MAAAVAHQVIESSTLEIPMRDGSTVQLHAVLHNGCRDAGLRAVRADAGGWMVIDLVRLHPDLRRDFGRLLPRDWPGLVLYTVRLGYAGATDFYQRALAAGVAVASTTAA